MPLFWLFCAGFRALKNLKNEKRTLPVPLVGPREVIFSFFDFSLREKVKNKNSALAHRDITFVLGIIFLVFKVNSGFLKNATVFRKIVKKVKV